MFSIVWVSEQREMGKGRGRSPRESSMRIDGGGMEIKESRQASQEAELFF